MIIIINMDNNIITFFFVLFELLVCESNELRWVSRGIRMIRNYIYVKTKEEKKNRNVILKIPIKQTKKNQKKNTTNKIYIYIAAGQKKNTELNLIITT